LVCHYIFSISPELFLEFPYYVIVPVGGGGLLAGIATAVKAMNPNILVIVSFKGKISLTYCG
jgi:threonine dehydratase